MSSVKLSDLLPDHRDPRAGTVSDRARHHLDPQVALAERLDAARAEGYAAGCADTRAQLSDAATRAATGLTAALTAVHEEAAAAAADAVRADAGDVAEAAWRIACWAIGRELAMDPAALTAAVDDALGQVEATVTVTVYTHPDTQAAVQPWAEAHQPHPVRLLPDPLLAPGELRVHTDTGTRIEATVSEIGRRALARLAGTVAASGPEQESDR